jgi:hypothetical protein
MRTSEPQPPIQLPAPPAKPCQGPHCSRGDSLPLPAPAPAPSTAGERWGCVSAELPPCPPIPSLLANGGLACRPVRLPQSVYHPPRA